MSSTFAAKDFSLHPAQFHGDAGGWFLAATMKSIGLYVTHYVKDICHLFWQLSIFFCWEMYLSLSPSMMQDFQKFSFPASLLIRTRAYNLEFTNQM